MAGDRSFFWSYVLFSCGKNLLLAAIGARISGSAAYGIWYNGALLGRTAVVTGETSFVAVRFLLGIAEQDSPGVAYS